MLPDLQLPLGLQPQPVPCEFKLAFDSLKVSPLSSKILPWPWAHSTLLPVAYQGLCSLEQRF